MFELLLQADKSMSNGLLDQAERTYWRLIELDPTNAIALACLARISLKRGDGRLARTFADRAIGIDPDSIVARKVIHALEEGSAMPEDSSTPDINLRGAERLEALSRRRRSQLGGDEGGDEGGEGAESSGRARTSGRAKPVQPPAPAPAPTPGSMKPVRGRTQPDQLEPLPAEPLRERRKTGRLAATTAAAAAAAREPMHTRHEPHHAMPTGRRMFEPRPVNAAPDPFAAAEMAAAVAAVDAMDEPYETEPSVNLAADTADTADTAAEVAAEHAARGEANAEAAAEVQAAADVEDAAELEAAAEAEAEPVADAAHVMEAVDATGFGESVALRLAFLSSPIPEGPAEPESQAEPEVGGAPESTAAAEQPTSKPAAQPGPVEAVERYWWRHDPQQPAVAPAEPEAEAAQEVAETQAVREAMAIALLAQNVDDTAGEPGSVLEHKAATPDPAETEPQTHCAEAPPDANAPEEAPAEQDTAPRKRGLFRRFRG
jgi:tetratricopeptide (TPR) repeat protein